MISSFDLSKSKIHPAKKLIPIKASYLSKLIYREQMNQKQQEQAQILKEKLMTTPKKEPKSNHKSLKKNQLMDVIYENAKPCKIKQQFMKSIHQQFIRSINQQSDKENVQQPNKQKDKMRNTVTNIRTVIQNDRNPMAQNEKTVVLQQQQQKSKNDCKRQSSLVNIKNNIFDTSTGTNEFQTFEQGPIFKDTSLVKYSLVGTETEFMKMKKYHEQRDNSNYRLISRKQSNESIDNSQSKYSGYKYSGYKNSGEKDMHRQYGILALNQKKVRQRKMHKYTKRQLLDNLDQLKENKKVSEFDRQEIRKRKVMNKSSDNQMNSLNKYYQVSRDWKQQRQIGMNRCGKDYSVMDYSNSFRCRQEVNEMVDKLNDIKPKDRKDLWVNSLRRYEEEKNKELGEIEIIRKNNEDDDFNVTMNRFNQDISRLEDNKENSMMNTSQQMVMFAQYKTMQSFRMPTIRPYQQDLQEKFNNYKKQLSKIVAQTDHDQIDGLKVDGINVMKKEEEWLQNDGKDLNTVYFKYVDNKADVSEKIDIRN